MRWKTARFVLAALIVMGGCGAPEVDEQPQFYGDGQLPVDKRQPLEEFVSEIEPRIVEFMQTLDAAGANLYLPRSNESLLESCGYPVYGYRLRGPRPFGLGVDESKIVALYEEHIKPLGFDYVRHTTDSHDTEYRWFNTRDGGYVYVILHADGNMVAGYMSACRPYHGAGKPEHVRTAWEQELISRQPPTPDPSESPTSNKTAIGEK
ncbi:DUF4853 domain-containing protein [Buchananella hordeovulneris]|uniref:DUF4853 domain-containing protein n=1 Tax=Buchananella hordeovulneris TaxID=52770 RepID=UPI0026DD7B0C|nr:DUF4853 domain-containing protein [Buchananella hordeovulneris]MDO5081441.1 DUF4853 domain-containing protein [Buchananella hordeovulneris]